MNSSEVIQEYSGVLPINSDKSISIVGADIVQILTPTASKHMKLLEFKKKYSRHLYGDNYYLGTSLAGNKHYLNRYLLKNAETIVRAMGYGSTDIHILQDYRIILAPWNGNIGVLITSLVERYV